MGNKIALLALLIAVSACCDHSPTETLIPGPEVTFVEATQHASWRGSSVSVIVENQTSEVGAYALRFYAEDVSGRRWVASESLWAEIQGFGVDSLFFASMGGQGTFIRRVEAWSRGDTWGNAAKTDEIEPGWMERNPDA